MENKKDVGVFLEEKFLLEIMPSVDAEYIRIYIMAKYLSKKNGRTDVQTVSDALGMDRNLVYMAVRSFESKGVMSVGKDEIIDFDNDKKATAVTDRVAYVKGEVGAAIEADRSLADMLELAQKILGKMLSYPAIEKLYGLYDWLGMTPELILRLLEYCAEIDKKDMRYIEKVALSWHEMGISSVAQAEEYIKHQNYKRSYEYKIKSVLGIGDRALAVSEQKYIQQWYEAQMSVELVRFAYDYCVTKTGKYAVAYINKVLMAWHENGIKTPAQAKTEIEKFSAQRAENKSQAASAGRNSKKLEVYNSGRYDYDKIDALAREKLKKRLGKE